MSVVANPVRGLLDRKRSEEHLQKSSNESKIKNQQLVEFGRFFVKIYFRVFYYAHSVFHFFVEIDLIKSHFFTLFVGGAIILGAWCKSPKKRILSYKDALQRTEYESVGTTVRSRRLLWTGALLRMGDNRLPQMIMSGELENAGKRGSRGKEKEWTDCEADFIFDYLASRGTGAPPHLTLGYGTAQYTKGAVGLWPRG